MGVRHRELLALRDKHGFLLVLDDAHATLVCDGHAQSSLQRSAHGRAGTLAAEAADMSQLCKRADVVVGTMSKAMGSQGGFVCCSSDMRCLVPSLLPRPCIPSPPPLCGCQLRRIVLGARGEAPVVPMHRACVVAHCIAFGCLRCM